MGRNGAGGPSSRRGWGRWASASFSDTRVYWSRELHKSVTGDDFLVEVGAELRSSLLRFEVDVMDAEAIGVTIGPLIVIHEAPAEVAFDGYAFGDAAMKLRQIVAEVHDAVGVVDVAVGGEDVGGGGSVLGDVDLFDSPDLGDEPGTPVEALRADAEPGTHHMWVGGWSRDHDIAGRRAVGANPGGGVVVE